MPESSKKRKNICCPSCRGEAVHRSRRKGLRELLMHRVLFVSPFRCYDCDERFFRNRLAVEPMRQPMRQPMQ